MLYIAKPSWKNWGLHWEGTKEDWVAMKGKMLRFFRDNRKSHPFFQSGFTDQPTNYLFVEFWTDNDDQILADCLAFADQHSMILDIL